MIGVDKIDDIRNALSQSTVASIARGHRVSEPTGEEVPEGARPLREAAGGREGARVAAARALRGADRLVAARGQALLVQAAPHRQAGLRPPRRGEGLRGLLHHRPEVREAQARGARRGARRPRGAGVPPARLAAGRVPGRLRAGRLPRARRHHAGHFLVVTFPHSNVGLAQVFWGETAECVCQGAPRRLRVPRGRAAARRVRQRHRGRTQGRHRDQDLGDLPPVRRATTGSTTASPTPTRGTRRGPWRTRSARSGATCSSRSRRSGT